MSSLILAAGSFPHYPPEGTRYHFPPIPDIKVLPAGASRLGPPAVLASALNRARPSQLQKDQGSGVYT